MLSNENKKLALKIKRQGTFAIQNERWNKFMEKVKRNQNMFNENQSHLTLYPIMKQIIINDFQHCKYSNAVLYACLSPSEEKTDLFLKNAFSMMVDEAENVADPNGWVYKLGMFITGSRNIDKWFTRQMNLEEAWTKLNHVILNFQDQHLVSILDVFLVLQSVENNVESILQLRNQILQEFAFTDLLIILHQKSEHKTIELLSQWKYFSDCKIDIMALMFANVDLDLSTFVQKFTSDPFYVFHISALDWNSFYTNINGIIKSAIKSTIHDAIV